MNSYRFRECHYWVEEHLRPEESLITNIHFSLFASDLTGVLVLLKLVRLDIFAILDFLFVILAVFLDHIFADISVFFLINYCDKVP